ncbi:MAG: molybdopterin molybdotransferase MoeA [Alphaproteobacteria bacterium]|nr:molybdopterin molybdotransferase MoeA [Alphaproteobacteria bacterium]
MAQLSDDCFAFGGGLTPLSEALETLLARAKCLVETESAPLDRAAGRILGADVTAAINVPAFDNAAVDGYAVRIADLKADEPTILPVVGRAPAGGGRPPALADGAAMRIFTGAPLPAGADTVMMQEDCDASPDGASVRIRSGIARGANARLAGEDVQAGATLLRAGRRLRIPDIGLLAGQGLTDIRCRAPLRCALFSTGDEVRDPGEPLADGQVYDANRHMLAAALMRMGLRVLDLGVIADRPDAVEQALRRSAAEADVILSSGGMSTGEEDHVRAVVEANGRLDFWRLSIKPGRPVGLGQVAFDGKRVTVIGLPGNPVAAFTTFALLAQPLFQKFGGETITPPRRFPATLGFAYRKKKGRREFVRVRLDGVDSTGRLILRKHGKSGAGILISLSGADGFAELSEEAESLESGSPASYLPFSELLP